MLFRSPALHRTARGHGGLVIDQPATQADQDRRPRRAPCPCHHLPTGRGGGHRRHGPGHPCRDPSIASATVMCMTALPPQTERNRQDRSACCAEKRRHQARSRRVRGPIRPAPAVCATTDTAQSEERLLNSQNQAIFTSDGRPLGVCRYKGTYEQNRVLLWD